MAKRVDEWTEDDVLSLPRDENDTFERKGALLLDLTLPQVKEGNVLDELAKQLSAFANTGGGRLIYGITDTGIVDNGGVARSVKGKQSTKGWLEDVIPNLTDFEIVGVNVYEIPPKATGSALAADKSLYIVAVPDSQRAPHQSKRDLKYYVRLGGTSQPASHRLIEDIRNRARHPGLEVHDLRIINAVAQAPRVAGLKSEFELNIGLQFAVSNKGRVRAANACLQLSATVPLSTSMGDGTEYFPRSATQGTVLFEMKNPIYPTMGVVFGCSVKTSAEVQLLPIGAPLTLSGCKPEDVTLSITIFADSAPARSQDFKLGDIDPEHRFMQLIELEAKRIHSSGQRTGINTGRWS
jgi:hypothetical protein